MGCCPPIPPKLSAVDAPPDDNFGQQSDILNGESAECYGKNSANPTGQHDDATDQVENKIENSSISVDCKAKVDVTFRLTKNSTKVPTVWTMEVLEPANAALIGIAFNSSGATAKMVGTFDPALHNKSIKVLITAKDTAEIDSRTFVFSPALCSGNDSIQLISPLPGAIINSKWGLRMHPIRKIMKHHAGIDMKYADRSVGDVVAACDGEITFAGNTGSGYGIAVKIKHINSSGKHLCTTTYNHLNKVYVVPGQKVAAGQKIGREGTTGASTGNHLHFELRLPNNSNIDPEPYFRGEMKSARVTTPSNDPDPTVPLETKTENKKLTPSNVDAKMNGCSPFGENYTPKPDNTPKDPPPEGIDDPFELAWFFTMKHEVGKFWSTSDKTKPTDPDVAAGLIETADQKKRVGFVQDKTDRGGVTKFGVAQKANRNVNVNAINYQAAKTLGYNKYWKANSTGKAKHIAVHIFDLTYLYGPGGAKSIINSSGANMSVISNPQASKSEQLEVCAKLRDSAINRARNIVDKNPSQKKYINGWTNRANEIYAYVASL